MKKAILGLLVLVVLAVGGALYYVLTNLDSIVAGIIESEGSRILGTSVSVSGVSIDLRGGTATIAGLRVANPKGFSSNDAFTLGRITVGIDVGTVRQSPIKITQVSIADPEVRLEVNETGGSNVKALENNAAKAGGGGSSEPADSGGGETKLLVERFSFEGGKVHADASSIPGQEGAARTVDLPALNLKNLGAPNGAPPGEIGAEVARAFTRNVTRAVARGQLDRAIDEHVGGEAGEAAKKAIKGLFGD